MTDKDLNISSASPLSFDAAVIGGGLAGLSISILLARSGFRIILFEKETYPFHRVCGEYISMESWDFLCSLGLPLPDMNLPVIKKLIVSAPNGKILKHDLPLGGFGISRYTLDHELVKIARANGVTVMENCRVNDVIFHEGKFRLETQTGTYVSTACSGTFGKRSNLDIKWQRPFVTNRPGKLNNYIGVKYHVKTTFPEDTIALHNFRNGYCGISRVEGEKYCFCYLTTAANLKLHHNQISEMEKAVLSKNPELKKLFVNMEILSPEPVVISQVSFEKKSTIEQHLMMSGDAAGMIAPLCGNGMSMAMHAGKLAAQLLVSFLQGNISRDEMERQYSLQWNKHFEKRLATGRMIQRMFGKPLLTNMFISTMASFPKAVDFLIRQTHGRPF